MTRDKKTALESSQPILMLALLALLLALYVGLRFDWRWLTGDAEILSSISQSLFEEPNLTSPGSVYQHGYIYPVLNVIMANITGIPISALQLFIQPFLIVLLVPVAYITFASFTGTFASGFLASFILFLQSEFLFEAVRSSHSKITWLMALSLLFILVASIRSAGDSRLMIKWTILFYIVAYALIASNSFFAANYIFSISFAFLGGSVIRRFLIEGTQIRKLHRLLFITLSCCILVYLFMFYAYPPALHHFNFLQSIWDKFAALFLDLEVATNPYRYVTSTWINSAVYLSLTLLNWLLLGISSLAWLDWTRKLIRRQPLPVHRLLLWLFYPAFAMLMVLSVLLDFSGVLSSNLQVRIFPNFMIFAIPLASLAITGFIRKLQNRFQFPGWVAPTVLFLAFTFFSGASLLKVTNEPLLSNRWDFYTPAESRSLSWLSDYQKDAIIWSGFYRRLDFLSKCMTDSSSRNLVHLSNDQLSLNRHYIHYFLVSEVASRRAARMEVPLPDLRGTFKVYDNGQVGVYKTRPLTPYQR
jgi:hypothetical protein